MSMADVTVDGKERDLGKRARDHDKRSCSCTGKPGRYPAGNAKRRRPVVGSGGHMTLARTSSGFWWLCRVQGTPWPTCVMPIQKILLLRLDAM